MKIIKFLIINTLCLFVMGKSHPLQAQNKREAKAHNKVLKLMGSRFEVTAVSENDSLAWQAINAAIDEITRIERLISSWDTKSQTSAVNRQAGIKAVQVDEELFRLIARSLKVSKLTDGAFDISFASIDKIWKFDGSMEKMPHEDKIAASVAKINYENILLNEDKKTVFLRKQGMKIGFGAIGKGYAANRAKQVMQALGIKAGLVNAGGDLTAWGQQADGKNWRIAIADPNDKTKVLAWLAIKNTAIVTSGDYERFVTFDGKRYAHIINPRTGYPTTGIKSVTIVCPDAEIGDALATSVFVLGEKAGLSLINQLKGVECLIITDENEVKTSENLELNYL